MSRSTDFAIWTIFIVAVIGAAILINIEAIGSLRDALGIPSSTAFCPAGPNQRCAQ